MVPKTTDLFRVFFLAISLFVPNKNMFFRLFFLSFQVRILNFWCWSHNLNSCSWREFYISGMMSTQKVRIFYFWWIYPMGWIYELVISVKGITFDHVILASFIISFAVFTIDKCHFWTETDRHASLLTDVSLATSNFPYTSFILIDSFKCISSNRLAMQREICFSFIISQLLKYQMWNFLHTLCWKISLSVDWKSQTENYISKGRFFSKSVKSKVEMHE